MVDSAERRRVTDRRRQREANIAYFSMEIGINSDLPTYSGGLGILAGDTLKACADLKVPIVGVTLLYWKGYFRQTFDKQGGQIECPNEWDPKKSLKLLAPKVLIKIEGRPVLVQAWQYLEKGRTGHNVPILFLDTNLESNNPCDRTLTDYLYGGDDRYRLAQEIVLGIGGVRILKELGYKDIRRYHMNEGHASLLTLELLDRGKKDLSQEMEEVRTKCVFTTHTPVPAGHDQFPYDLVSRMLGDYIPIDFLKSVGGDQKLNMTLLALNLSHYLNGVAKLHGKISREMFPGYSIEAITNGVFSPRWVSKSFKKLFDKYISGWRVDPYSFRYAISLPREEIWNAHMEAKKKLIDYVSSKDSVRLDYDTLTIGFARRATLYKRADLIFHNIKRLTQLCAKAGQIQLIFSGKAHPNDCPAKELIKKIFKASAELKNEIKIVYLENYDIELAKMLVSGVDLWLNTPRKPQEASGTSGMKAAHNGIPSLSILDGWWIEGCIEGLTGWSIGRASEQENKDDDDASSLYEKLEKIIIPTYYNNRTHWIDIMRRSIAFNASFFNTHRMVQQYVLNAYL